MSLPVNNKGDNNIKMQDSIFKIKRNAMIVNSEINNRKNIINNEINIYHQGWNQLSLSRLDLKLLTNKLLLTSASSYFYLFAQNRLIFN